MPTQATAELTRSARAVLDRNRRGTYTCPSARLYPHQWLWDSCFTAIGLSTYDPQRAVGELRSLFRGQWANGMVPHMIFAEGHKDVGSRRIWQSKRFPDAPRDLDTTCVTQPPLLSIAAWHVARALPDGDRRDFLADVFPRLVRYHRWLYLERDLPVDGLVTLIHPWECGLDTTPPWMRRLRHMPTPWWMRAVMKLRLTRLARFFRRDTRYLPESERLSDDDGLRMLVLVYRAKRDDFDIRRMTPDESVQIEDLPFNALLAVANRSLRDIAGELGASIDGELEACLRRADGALEQLWDDETGQYYSRNAFTGTPIKIPTVATFLPLWSGVPTERVTRLLDLLQTDSFWPAYPVPSVPVDAPHYDEDRYWRGPTWINTNWAIIQGLRMCDQPELADELTHRTLELVEREGFAEYFSAITGIGYGAEDFSWTAALVLDLLESRP
jgi:hypothetical protein